MRRKSFAWPLAVSMLMTTVMPYAVLADDVMTDEGASYTETAEVSMAYEPWAHGYRFADIKNWSPETDEYASQLRARVPLQDRNEAFAATQANPGLTMDAQVYNVSMGNYRSTGGDCGPWNGGQYYDDFSYNLFKFWQYTDYIGCGGRPTAGFNAAVSEETGKLEYGIVAIPIAAFVNTAHKNGVKALGEYFIPRDPQYTEEWLYKDENGNFPYAQKLVDIMNYYGFDGYFINQEKGFDADKIPLFKEMIAWMTSQGCYIQWYDAINPDGTVSYQNEFNKVNSQWVYDEEIGQVSNSIWLNYWWNEEMIQSSAEYAQSLGLNPHETLFLGIECGMGRFEGGNLYSVGQCKSEATVEYLDWVLDETGNPKTSLALWGSDFTHEAYWSENGIRYLSGYQWAAEERERLWYTSPKESAVDHTTDGVERSDVGLGSEVVWKGISRYIAERSAIRGTVFATNFNTGHGMQYYQDGEVSRDMEWSNMNLQDFMPTWQWWVETEGTPLELDWDYGPEQEKILKDGTVSEFDYTQIGAYEGGSSLVIYGDLKAEEEQYIHLYKTDLDVTENSEIRLVFAQDCSEYNIEDAAAQLMLTFKDDPENPYLIPLTGAETDSWTEMEGISLAEHAGRTIASIGVRVESAVDVNDYQINLGEIKLTDGTSKAPEVPQDFRVDKVFDETGEVELSWTLDEDYDTVKMYHIYAVYEDGSERFVTGAYADNMYIPSLENPEQVVGFNLRAVGADKSESELAFAALNTENGVWGIATVSRDGKLFVTWGEPNTACDEIEVKLEWWYADREEVEPIVLAGDETKAVFDVGIEDGSKYVLRIAAKGDCVSEICYFGQLADNYCEPYDGDLRLLENGETYSLPLPDTDDWKRLQIIKGNEAVFYARFMGKGPYGFVIPEDVTEIHVTTEDWNGNESEPVVFAVPK